MSRLTHALALSGCLAVTIFTPSVSAAESAVAISDLKSQTIQVPLNKSRLLHLKTGNITAIKLGNPNIAKLDTLPPNKLLVQGMALGTTNVVISGGTKEQILNIEVTHDLETLKTRFHELLPGEPIEVRSSQQNIVLSGQVSGLDKIQSAVDIAESFLPVTASGSSASSNLGNLNNTQSAEPPTYETKTTENTPWGKVTRSSVSQPTTPGSKPNSSKKANGPSVINMLSVSGAHQVMLEVKVAEIDRRVAKGLNIQFNAMRPGSNVAFGALNGGGTFSPIVTNADAYSTGYSVLSNVGGIAGPIRSLLHQSPHSIDAAGIFLSALSGDFIFNLTVDAAKDQDLARILAEPTLTTMSGEEATFHSGGEFPIPVPRSSAAGIGTVTIEFKKFGISLHFTPVVLDTGRINLNMNVRVSELSNDAAVVADIPGSDLKFTIPSLTVREASNSLELADGQTMSIAGLISNSTRENVNKFPGLGDVPVLGAMFRNEKFLKNQTELVIFVTPKLAKPTLAKNIVLPTDNFVEPDDIDFYVFGKLEARDAEKTLRSRGNIPGAPQGGLDGAFGHQLSEGKP